MDAWPPAPAGAAHFFYNAGAGGPEQRPDLVLRFALSPCGAHPSFFDNLAGLSADAKGRRGVPLLQLVLLFHAHGLELATLPRWQWRTLVLVAAPLAQLLGYKAAYPEYKSAGGREPGWKPA